MEFVVALTDSELVKACLPKIVNLFIGFTFVSGDRKSVV